ncbi:VanW family protein [Nocardioides plantarum]|uniref:VanW family protein n=1 Tax=Nocardioides plantarum TaxID=29299 RepID=A0ABV5KC74_9ACTN|nr:VanW family protein [Nocardioides plantarum]
MKNRDERHERAGGRTVLVVVLVLALLAGGGYAAAYGLAGDKLPRGASVAGVDLGGLTQAEAEATLRSDLPAALSSPIRVTVDGSSDGRSVEVDPAEAGLEIDYPASVAAAGEQRSWSPGALWEHYTGGDDVDPVVTVDDAALEAALADLGDGLGTEPVDGRVRFSAGRVAVTDPEPGRGIDPAGAREALVASYLDGKPARLAVATLAPDIDDADVAEAVDTFADPAMSGSVELRIGSASVKLSPRQYSRALSMKAEDGKLVPVVDADRLVPLVERATSGKGAPVDARIEIRDGKPRIVAAKPGVTFESDAVVTAFLAAVVKRSGKRVGKVEGTVAEPDFTTADAKALGVKEKVSEFTTYFPYAEYRNVNIGRGAEIIDGTLLKPGETFSLNDIVGERTVENGFTEGTIISNGLFVKDLGGGVSQVATTTFNAMFYAGLEDIEHKPHSVYIDRYPVGREATVAFGAVDLRFRNDTDHGVLIHTVFTPSTPSSRGVLTVQMFSTKTWDITEVTSDRYAFTSPKTQTLTTDNCVPNSGYGGFQVDVTRIFKRPGSDEVVKREKFHTDYIASDTVICK